MATPVDTEDTRQARLTKAAAEAMGRWFIEQGILRKRVGELSYLELTGLATAAISGWLLADSREREVERRARGSQPLENTSPSLM